MHSYKLVKKTSSQACFLLIGFQIFPNLEDLYLESKDASALLKSLCPQDFYYKLKVLNLSCFHGAHATFPIDLLPRFPKMEKLIAGCSEFKELLPSRLDGMEKHARVLSRIRYLELKTLPCLEHLWKSNSQLDQALQTLETLVISKISDIHNSKKSGATHKNEYKGLRYGYRNSSKRGRGNKR
uniref:Disease resistance protein At4g27190-like leucine-rich repeats domain-containing protein n=1 Tax=Populus trichocarpa TaxID=3694 RepID=A0A2K2ABC9_POPTR